MRRQILPGRRSARLGLSNDATIMDKIRARPARGPRPIAFARFVDQVLDLYRPPLRAPATQRRMRQLLRLLGELGPRSTADLTTGLICRYISWRAESVCTNSIVGELSYLASACSHAVDEGWLDRSPFDSRRLEVREEPPADKSWHPLAHVRKVLRYLERRAARSWLDHRLFAMAATVAYTGLRRNEALCLKVADVDFRAGLLLVEARPRLNRLKTRASAAPVPIPPELRVVLRRWIRVVGSDWLFPAQHRRGPWLGGNASARACDRLKAAGEACGVTGLTLQSLRHSWATHAEGPWHLGEGQIQRVLRHTRPMTSRRYRHADAANLREIGRNVTILGR